MAPTAHSTSGSHLVIDKTWDGQPIPETEQVRVELALDAANLNLEVVSPYYADPPPAGAPGHTERLWEHEVVELFLLGDAQRYLEIEFGPHGHYLALLLHGARKVEQVVELDRYEAQIEAGSWRGVASVSRTLLPAGIRRGNACAIHGVGQCRRYLSTYPLPGARPDFHRLDCFGALALTSF